MADKRRVKKSIKQLQRVKTWQLLLLLVFSLLLSATFLRLNNIGMIERRTAVLNSDKRGIDQTTEQRLFDLQRYAAAHMNADSGVFYLEAAYERDVRKITEARDSQSETAKDRQKADAICKSRYGGIEHLAYVYCFTDQLSAAIKARGGTPEEVKLPSPELYRHEFTSPFWSPDFAGFSILVSLFITVVIVLRLISLGVLRLLLRQHYKAI